MRVPKILDEQVLIIKWARGLKKKYINLNFILQLITSPSPNQNYKDDAEYLEVRDIYQRYNSRNKDNILMAIMMDCYSLENDFEEGDIVTNGTYVGFARDIDLSQRDFYLAPVLNNSDILGKFKMIDFSKVK